MECPRFPSDGNRRGNVVCASWRTVEIDNSDNFDNLPHSVIAADRGGVNLTPWQTSNAAMRPGGFPRQTYRQKSANHGLTGTHRRANGGSGNSTRKNEPAPPTSAESNFLTHQARKHQCIQACNTLPHGLDCSNSNRHHQNV